GLYERLRRRPGQEPVGRAGADPYERLRRGSGVEPGGVAGADRYDRLRGGSGVEPGGVASADRYERRTPAPAATPSPPVAPPPPRAERELPDALAGRQVGSGAGFGFGRGGAYERDLVRRVTAPVSGSRRIVVLSIKGGVGKTTSVAVVGSLLSALRRDRVVALDASSD